MRSMICNGMMAMRMALLALLAVMPLVAQAEIEQVVMDCDKKICFRWWPKLAAVQGWHHDRASSVKFNYNAQAPDGSTFDRAPAVIYAEALLKPSMPELETLQMVIDSDQQKALAADSLLEVNEVPELTTRDGQKLKSFMFHSPVRKSWERVSYGEEEQFYLIFTLSAGSSAGYKNALEAYEQFVGQYKK